MIRQITPFAWLILIPILVFGAPAASTSSPWSVRVWQSDDGLPNNFVTGLAHTSDGYLWVATYSSPARFDGVNFEEFLPRDFTGVSNEKITALVCNRQGGLWMGALHGSVFLLTADSVQSYTTDLPNRQVMTMTDDREGGVWLTYQGGAVCLIKNGRVQTFTAEEGLPAATLPQRYVCSLALDHAGRLWFAKDGHIGIFREGRFETLLQLRNINARLTPAKAGGVWICSDGQLLRYDEGKPVERRGTFAPAQLETEPTVLLEDHAGGVWIGTADSGLFHYNGTEFETIPTSDRWISSLAEDRQGNLWVGTNSGGLNRVGPRVIELETTETGLASPMIQSICEDTTGVIWATTQHGLLIQKENGTWKTFSTSPEWPGGRASAVVADPAGGIWIGTRDRGLYRWKNGRFDTWRRKDGLAGREVHGLLMSKAGDLWIAQASPDVVQRYRDGRLETFPAPPGTRVLRTMTEDTKGNIWVGTTKGMLLRITGDTVYDLTAETTGTPLSIRRVHATPDGSVWIGYADEGIGWYKNGRFTHLTSKQGFPENNVSQIIDDDQGWLWFGGDHGLFKTRRTDLEALAAGRATKAHYIRYRQSEGLFSLEANFGDSPGALRSRDGRLWIPMRTALAVVDPSRQRPEPGPPPVLLKRVVVDDQTLAMYGGVVGARKHLDLGNPHATLSLPPQYHRLEFEFTALSFSAPENVRFRYRLEGFDEAWIEAGTQRSASYSRLASGNYRFNVQACNRDGVWNERGAALAFTVAPFPWQRWWFQVGALVLLVSMIGAIVRYISLRRVRLRLKALEEQAALHKERTRIARDLHDEFGTRLTELGLIAELEQKKIQNGFTPDPGGSELVSNIRALERDLDTIVWAVNPKNDTLDHLVGFICRVSAEFLNRSGIRCRLEIPDEVPSRPLSPELRHHLFLVVREAVTNVVKHSSATLVKLTVVLENDLFYLGLENDGRGFSVPEAEACERSGLLNMRSRIAELGGTMRIDSDLAKGTKIEFSVPLDPVSDALRPFHPNPTR